MRHVFRDISATRTSTAKRTTPSDSARRIGLATILKDILTVDEGVCGWRLKNRESRHVFRHISTTIVCTSKQTIPLQSAHRIGLVTILKDILTVDKECGWRLKNREMGTHFSLYL